METVGLARIAVLGTRALSSSAEAIAVVAELAQRITAIDITIVSEVTADGRYLYRGLARPGVPVESGGEIPYERSLCSRVHAGESPATVPDTREVPALWHQWLRLKEDLGVDCVASVSRTCQEGATAILYPITTHGFHEAVGACSRELAPQVRDVLVDEPRLDLLASAASRPNSRAVSRTSTPATSALKASCSITSGPHTVVAGSSGRPLRRATNALAFAASTLGETGFVTKSMAPSR